MSAGDLIEHVRNGVIRISFRKDGKTLASGSGFMCGGLLITNNHVFRGPEDSTVTLSWQPTKDPASLEELEIDRTRFTEALVTGSDANNFDYAALRINELHEKGLYEFLPRAPTASRVGDQIVILGFPFDHPNLVCHLGYISSFYLSGQAQVIQLDASVNVSNSGGPLIDLSTGDVIGIVTRKQTGFTRVFDELKNALFTTRAALRGLNIGDRPLSGVSIGHLAIDTNRDLINLVDEIYRSANVGIGFAFSIEHLLEDIQFQDSSDETGGR